MKWTKCRTGWFPSCRVSMVEELPFYPFIVTWNGTHDPGGGILSLGPSGVSEFEFRPRMSYSEIQTGSRSDSTGSRKPRSRSTTWSRGQTGEHKVCRRGSRVGVSCGPNGVVVVRYPNTITTRSESLGIRSPGGVEVRSRISASLIRSLRPGSEVQPGMSGFEV